MDFTRLLEATAFAADKHSAQRRKSGAQVPFINHPLCVATLLAKIGGVQDEAVLMAAVLHDTLEDTATTPQELQAAFGPTVLALVEEVTDDKSLPGAERKRLQIVHAERLSSGAALIRLADKCSNVRDIGHSPPTSWSAQRVSEYLDWAEAVVRNLPATSQALQAHFADILAEARRQQAQCNCE